MAASTVTGRDSELSPGLSADQVGALLAATWSDNVNHCRRRVDNSPATCLLCPFAGNSRNVNITRLEQLVRERSRVRLPGAAPPPQPPGQMRIEGDEA